MDREIDVLVIGGANVDYLVRGPALPKPGVTAVGHEFQEAMGGKGANQAIAAARLGARVAFVGRVGSDEHGQRVVTRLVDERVDASRVAFDAEAPTGIALIMVDGSGEKMIMTAPGANRRLSPHDIGAAAPLFAAAEVVLVQLEPEVATVHAAMLLARERGARVVLDAAPPVALPDAMVALVDVLRANANEAEVLTGIPVRDAASARAAADAMLARGAGAVCFATGSGDLLVWPEGEVRLPRLPVEVVDSTGAGDAFAAGLAVGLAEGKSLADAGWLGCAASALKTTRLGAQAGLPRRDAVERLLREHR